MSSAFGIRKFVPEGWKSQQEFGEPVDQGWWVSTDHLLLLQLFGLAVLLQGDENFVSESFDSRHRRRVQVARVRVEQHYCTQAPQLSYVLQYIYKDSCEFGQPRLKNRLK